MSVRIAAVSSSTASSMRPMMAAEAGRPCRRREFGHLAAAGRLAVELRVFEHGVLLCGSVSRSPIDGVVSPAMSDVSRRCISWTSAVDRLRSLVEPAFSGPPDTPVSATLVSPSM